MIIEKTVQAEIFLLWKEMKGLLQAPSNPDMVQPAQPPLFLGGGTRV